MGPGPDVHDGLRRPLPGGEPGPPVTRRRVLDRARPGDERAVRRVRRRDRVPDRRRAPARPGRLPRRTRGEPAARFDGLHRDARPGRSAPPDPVVDVDTGRIVATSGGPSLVTRSIAKIIPSCTSPTRTPRRTPPGPDGRCRPRRNGRPPPAAAWTRRRYTWGDEPETDGERLANYWHGDFPWRPDPRLRDARPPSARSRPTATDCTTWPATSGSGPPTGTRSGRHGESDVARLLRPQNPRGAAEEASYRPAPAAVPGATQGDQGRLLPVRRQLLPALPAGGPPTADDRHRHEPRRVPLHQAGLGPAPWSGRYCRATAMR